MIDLDLIGGPIVQLADAIRFAAVVIAVGMVLSGAIRCLFERR